MGTIPPLNYQEWIEAFDQHKQYPEFQERNYMFTLADFKKYFFGNTYIECLEGLLA